jgi:hypothetical protein
MGNKKSRSNAIGQYTTNKINQSRIEMIILMIIECAISYNRKNYSLKSREVIN